MAACFALVLLCKLVLAAPPGAEELYTLADFEAWVGAVAFSPDSQTLAAADGAAIRLCEAATGKTESTLTGHADTVCALAFSPKGPLLASGGFDHTARLWNLQQRGGPLVLEGHRGAVMAVAFSPDGRHLATGGIDGTIRVWGGATGRHVATLEAHKSWVNSLAYSRDGARLASGGSDGTVKLWDATTPADRGGYQELATFEAEARDGEVRSVVFADDGRWLAAGSRYGIVRVWDTATREPLAALAAQPADVWTVAVSPNGHVLAAAGSEWKRPGEVTLWDTATWREQGRLPHAGEVLSLAFSPDGRLLACGCWNKSLIVWRLAPKGNR